MACLAAFMRAFVCAPLRDAALRLPMLIALAIAVGRPMREAIFAIRFQVHRPSLQLRVLGLRRHHQIDQFAHLDLHLAKLALEIIELDLGIAALKLADRFRQRANQIRQPDQRLDIRCR
jgi:hypothetical protein